MKDITNLANFQYDNNNDDDKLFGLYNSLHQ